MRAQSLFQYLSLSDEFFLFYEKRFLRRKNRRDLILKGKNSDYD